MTTATPTDIHSTLSDFLATLGGPAATNGGIYPYTFDMFGQMLNSVRDYSLLEPNKAITRQPQKAFPMNAPQLSKDQVGNKDFWSFLGQVASTAVPFIISAVSGKDYQGQVYQPPRDPKAIIRALPPSVQQNKDFWDALGGFLQNVGPIVADALAGKAFDPSKINTQALPLDKDVDWGKVAQTGLQILPFVLSFF
jgi:hypothetical protein